ncbi:MAG: methyltransferase domain-containing protein, partial [Deltaproteobacteria bacterium]|nr:methyltransferase domain-containing protein [Deltaproteobacteria bacterium]
PEVPEPEVPEPKVPEPVQAASEAGELSADEEPTPANGRTFKPEAVTAPVAAALSSEEPEVGPAAGGAVVFPEDLPADVGESAGGDAEEVSLSDVQVVRDTMEPSTASGAAGGGERKDETSAAPDLVAGQDVDDGLGDLVPPDLGSRRAGTADPFAPPATSEPPPRKRPVSEEPDGLGLEAPPSVISIPEDDVPRAPMSAEAKLAALEAAFLPGAESADVAAEAKPSEAAADVADDVAEELGDADVQSLEVEESEPSAAPLIAPERPRPSATPRPRARRRRRHGERRAWWEEIFDDEHIRSLPHYSADHTRHEVEFIERSLGVARGARVLDLGCGDGRHAVELAIRGFEVVGLDLSLPMLARAGDLAQARSVKLNFIQGDMRDLRFESTFDAVYCVGTTFGYFDDDTNVQVLANAARALKPGGRFLLQVCNRDHVLWHQPRSTWFQGDDRQYLEDTDFNFITSRVTVKRSWATSAGDQETVEYSIRLYSLHEMGKLFHAAGFRVIEISGRFATPGVFFGGDSPNLVLLAEKP